MNNKKNSTGGRPPKINPARNEYKIRLNDEDNARFLSLYEKSGMQKKAHFITARIFNESFKVLKIDKNAADYYSKLSTFHSQFRAIGVNYNQIVKALNQNFTEKKALSFLYKLEKLTIELVELSQKVVALTEQYEQNYLNE